VPWRKKAEQETSVTNRSCVSMLASVHTHYSSVVHISGTTRCSVSVEIVEKSHLKRLQVAIDANNFIKNLLMTKSRDCRSDLVKGHASRPYSNNGRHLLFIN